MERLAPQLVNDDTVRTNTTDMLCIQTTEYHYIVSSRAQHVRTGTLCCNLLDGAKSFLAIKQFHAVIAIPIARNHHTTAVDFSCGEVAAFHVHAAEALAGVGGWVVPFSRESLSDTQRLIGTATGQHFARFHRNDNAEVVRIDHLHRMPSAAAEILCRGRWNEPCGMPPDDSQFAGRNVGY